MMGAEPTPALEQGHSRPSGTEGGCEVRSSRRLCSVLLGGAVESALWKCRLQGDLSRRHHIAQALALSRDPFGRGGGSGAGELVWGVGFVEKHSPTYKSTTHLSVQRRHPGMCLRTQASCVKCSWLRCPLHPLRLSITFQRSISKHLSSTSCIPGNVLSNVGAEGRMEGLLTEPRSPLLPYLLSSRRQAGLTKVAPKEHSDPARGLPGKLGGREERKLAGPRGLDQRLDPACPFAPGLLLHFYCSCGFVHVMCRGGWQTG